MQFVRLDEPDASRSLSPPGDAIGTAAETDTMTRILWSRGELHPAPLGRGAVERTADDRIELRWAPGVSGR